MWSYCIVGLNGGGSGGGVVKSSGVFPIIGNDGACYLSILR